MDVNNIINEQVDVAVVFYADVSERLMAMPRNMKYHGREIIFTKLGLRHPTAQGKRMIHVFDMSDDVNDYRLEFDAEHLTWTLVSMIGGDYV